jgi:hypothetical protein
MACIVYGGSFEFANSFNNVRRLSQKLRALASISEMRGTDRGGK